MSDWNDLADELDAWHREGRRAHFWWRDDDATCVVPPLMQLLDLSARHDTPVALAVIPRDAEEGLREYLVNQRLASVLQHGWSHENHAPAGGRQEEFGVHRSLPAMLSELAEGWHRIGHFPRAEPVLVAPWNRLDPHLLTHRACRPSACSPSRRSGPARRPCLRPACGKPMCMSTSLIGRGRAASWARAQSSTRYWLTCARGAAGQRIETSRPV